MQSLALGKASAACISGFGGILDNYFPQASLHSLRECKDLSNSD